MTTDSEHVSLRGRWRKRDIALILLVGAFLFFPYLGLRNIWTSGEARVAQVARQMRESGDWVVPRLGDSLRLRKPPMAYWLCVISSLPWDDIDEFNSRIPNALAGIGIMVVMYLFGCHLFSRRAGWWAALAAGTTGVVWWQARTTGIEAPLLFFNLLAIYGWWRYYDSGEQNPEGHPRLAWLLLCYLALAGSALEKGPVGPVLLLLITYCFLFLVEQWRPGWLSSLAGLGMGLVVSLAVYGIGHRLMHVEQMGTPSVYVGIGAILGLTVFLQKSHWCRPPRWTHHALGGLLLLLLGMPWVFLVNQRVKEIKADLSTTGVLEEADDDEEEPVAVSSAGDVSGKKTTDVWSREFFGRLMGFDHIKNPFYFSLKVPGDGQPWVLIAFLALLLLNATDVRKVLRFLLWSHALFAVLFVLSKVWKAARFGRDVPDEEKMAGWMAALLIGGGALVVFVVTKVISRWVPRLCDRLADACTESNRRGLLFIFVWALVSLLFFSLPASKKSYYIMPVYPALALLAGLVIDHVLWDDQAKRLRIAVRGLFQFLGWLLFSIGVLAYPIYYVLTRHVDKFEKYAGFWGHLVAVAVLALALGVTLVMVGRGRWRLQTGFAGIIVATVFAFGVNVHLMPARNLEKGHKAICLAVRERIQPQDEVWSYALSGQPIFTFYLNHPVRKKGFIEGDMMPYLTGEGPGDLYILTTEEDADALKNGLGDRIERLPVPVLPEAYVWFYGVPEKRKVRE